MLVLVCNVGSTSLKFKLYDMPAETVLASGRAERVGDRKGGLFQYRNESTGTLFRDEKMVIPTYESGILSFLEHLTGADGAVSAVSDIDAVGFKTVLSKGHYGVHELDAQTLKGMEEYLVVAPQHNRFYLEAIRVFERLLPDTPRIGVFETAFHQTMPPEAYLYAVPYEWYEKYGVRRLGFHGASHAYVASRLNGIFPDGKYKAVSCHLGGSGSITAIVDGQSRDTSFGFSPQSGLPQTSRSGDIDPYIIFYLVQSRLMTLDEIEDALQKRSGLLGVSGISNDLRDLEDAAPHEPRAQLAIDIYCREIIRYIGGYAAIMGGLDCIAFTGGIGENSRLVRDKVLSHFGFLGLDLLKTPAEKDGIFRLTALQSKLKAYVIPANEELGIARAVAAYRK